MLVSCLHTVMDRIGGRGLSPFWNYKFVRSYAMIYHWRNWLGEQNQERNFELRVSFLHLSLVPFTRGLILHEVNVHLFIYVFWKVACPHVDRSAFVYL